MTAFVLVSGPFTGGWVWQEVTARLRGAGAEVHPVTLTGMGEDHGPAVPEPDLETHIEDLLRVLDGTDAAEVVLVGHDYGIHPVLGAADRRPERTARIVYLDAGMPQNGDAAVALVPDPAVRAELLNPAGLTDAGQAGTDPSGGTARAGRAEVGGDRRIPPPDAEGWQRWGSTAGLSGDALALLTRRAVPQPRGTLTQPLRLSGALSGLPTTGVFCTANGMSIAAVETLVLSGPPQFRALADPRVGFFDLATGHWPMLSAPDELAEVLLRAAEGEGHQFVAEAQEQPAYLRPFLLDVPRRPTERPRERRGRVDLYLPDAAVPDDAAGPRPAVVFVHGGPLSADLRPTPRDWPGFVGHSRYVAGLGAVGVMLDHRLHGLADYGRAAEDVAEAVELVRADPRVDGDRIALWFLSAGGLLSADWLAAPPPWLRCVAASYPVLAPLPSWRMVEPRFRPAVAVRAAGGLPVVLTRVGLEHAEIAATVAEFLAAAEESGVDVEVVDVPLGRHGFETVDPAVRDQAGDALRHATRSVLKHLGR